MIVAPAELSFLPRIAIYFPSLERMGGIERAIESQIRIFAKAGHFVLLITETPVSVLKDSLNDYCQMEILSSESDSDLLLQNLIDKHKPDFFIIHGAYYQKAKKIAEILQPLPVKSILNIHFSFPSPIYLTGDEKIFTMHMEVAGMCDAVAAVSELDKVWWQALGYRSFHVLNPFVDSSEIKTITKRPAQKSHTLIWVGRMMEPKQPLEAIYVLKLILQKIPNVKLLMVGGKLDEYGVMKHARKLRIAQHVERIEECKDIDALYQKASVFMLTSVTESFCLVIAEAKKHGLPVAMYSIPYLDPVAGGKGIVEAPLNNRTELANKIIKLLTDQDYYEKKSFEAVNSLAQLSDEHVLQSWEYIFNSLSTNDKSSDIERTTTELTQLVREIVQAWNYRIDRDLWKIQFWDNTEKVFGGKFCTILMRMEEKMFSFLKKIKHFFR